MGRKIWMIVEIKLLKQNDKKVRKDRSKLLDRCENHEMAEKEQNCPLAPKVVVK
jgi:hypothetical protein